MGSTFGFSMSTCGTLTAYCIVRLPLEDDSVVEDAATAPVSNLRPARALLLWMEEETCAKELSIAHTLPQDHTFAWKMVPD